VRMTDNLVKMEKYGRTEKAQVVIVETDGAREESEDAIASSIS